LEFQKYPYSKNSLVKIACFIFLLFMHRSPLFMYHLWLTKSPFLFSPSRHLAISLFLRALIRLIAISPSRRSRSLRIFKFADHHLAMNSLTLSNVGCPDCGGQLLRLVSHSIEDSGRVFRKSHVFYQCEKYKSVSRFLITLTDCFFFICDFLNWNKHWYRLPKLKQTLVMNS
jgi:hypothetical protein